VDRKLFWSRGRGVWLHPHGAGKLRVRIIPLNNLASCDKASGENSLDNRQVFIPKLKKGVGHMIVLDLADDNFGLFLDEEETVGLTVLDSRPII
jgi:hypothetical protein